MKKIFIFTIILVVLLSILGLCLPYKTNQVKSNADYLRIHIRANSNSEIDQEVKYLIKDEFVNYLTPKIAFCKSKQDVVNVVEQEYENLKNLADDVLLKNNFNYTSNVTIKTEMFPTRSYEGYTLNSGVYDALIVELGEAQGNNWWCVIYPPLCFTNYSSSNFTSVVYKSKIWEIIKKFFG